MGSVVESTLCTTLVSFNLLELQAKTFCHFVFCFTGNATKTWLKICYWIVMDVNVCNSSTYKSEAEGTQV